MTTLPLRLLPLLLLAAAAPAGAQQLSASERTKLQRVMRDGWREYEAAAGESPGAKENLEHVKRMLDAVQARRADLARRGIDADVVRAGVLFSDLGKNPARLGGLAQELFPSEFADPKTRGGAFFKAFLLHEVPGRQLFRETARQYGLSPETVRRVEAANVGHNGPGAAGSWWQGVWDAQIKSLRPNQVRLDGPHGDLVRGYLGRSYPLVQGLEGALHTALDRRDQGTRDGSLKIMTERMGRGESLRDAFNASFSSAPGGNQAMTQAQFDALRARYPQVFEIDVVQEAERAVRDTARYANHVQFSKDGKKARVHLPGGQTVEVTDAAGLRGALERIPRPSATRFRVPSAAAPRVEALARMTVPELLAEARRRGLSVQPPLTKEALVRALAGRGTAAAEVDRALAMRETRPDLTRREGATRQLERLVPEAARERARVRR